MPESYIRIAIDAMGGDTVPDNPVDGTMLALNTLPDIETILVGDKPVISRYLDEVYPAAAKAKKLPAVTDELRSRLSIEHADEVIEMGESPSRAIRAKKNSSLVVANKLCRSGDVQAVISAGNTGAAMASSLVHMGRLSGVMRPAICAPFPSEKGFVAVLDVGANVDSKPEHLYQFAVMASIYAAHIFAKKSPRVALLSIGEERGKGNELTAAAYDMLDKSHLHFIGNIEGRDIFRGAADVVVCDGFVGNVLLKFGESTFSFIAHQFRQRASRGMLRKLGALAVKPIFREIHEDMTSDKYGGAPLLGVDGTSIICHGNSNAVAIKNALQVARKLVDENVNSQIKKEFARKSSQPNE